MLFRGMLEDTLRVLQSYYSPSNNAEGYVQKLTLEAVALIRQRQIVIASRELSEAERICKVADYPSCGEALRARGMIAGVQGQTSVARQYYMETLAFARDHHWTVGKFHPFRRSHQRFHIFVIADYNNVALF